jgi:hypothetical protein
MSLLPCQVRTRSLTRTALRRIPAGVSAHLDRMEADPAMAGHPGHRRADHRPRHAHCELPFQLSPRQPPGSQVACYASRYRQNELRRVI